MKKMFTLSLVLSLTLLCGCSSDKTREDSDLDIIEIKANEEVSFDVDGDGEDNLVKYDAKINDEFGYIETGKLVIDDNEYYPTNACTPTKVWHAVKLDTKDNYYTFMLGDEGPSCDDTTDYVVYEDGEFKELGVTEGRLISIDGKELNDGIVLKGDHIVNVPIRCSIVQTWWYNADYEISKDKFEKKEKDFYDVDYDTELLQDMNFYLEPSLKAKTTLVRKDTIMKFIAVDDEMWTKVSYLDIYGEPAIAYFPCYGGCFLDEDYNELTADYFKDLCFAD